MTRRLLTKLFSARAFDPGKLLIDTVNNIRRIPSRHTASEAKLIESARHMALKDRLLQTRISSSAITIWMTQ
jgi:hypothetical protein